MHQLASGKALRNLVSDAPRSQALILFWLNVSYFEVYAKFKLGLLQMQTENTSHPYGLPNDLPPELNVLLGVHLLYWKIDEVVDAINVEPGLSKNERHVLVSLSAPCRMGELASELQILPSTLTALADGMEEKGILVRERDPDDRRAWRLCLTKEGAEKRQMLLVRASEIFANVSGLSKSETQTISDLMLKVAHNIKSNGLPEGAKPCN